jgi:hypothetical protein
MLVSHPQYASACSFAGHTVYWILTKGTRVITPPGVHEQLRCQGILEAIRIARAAYPNRLVHRQIIARYAICLRDTVLAKSGVRPSYPLCSLGVADGMGLTGATVGVPFVC